MRDPLDFESPEPILLDDIPHEVGRSREAVRKWVSRGLIVPMPGTTVVFDLRDVREVERKTRHRLATRKAG